MVRADDRAPTGHFSGPGNQKGGGTALPGLIDKTGAIEPLTGYRGEETMRAFHDAFLSYGSVPVRLVAEEMTTRARRGEPLGAHERPFLTTAAPS